MQGHPSYYFLLITIKKKKYIAQSALFFIPRFILFDSTQPEAFSEVIEKVPIIPSIQSGEIKILFLPTKTLFSPPHGTLFLMKVSCPYHINPFQAFSNVVATHHSLTVMESKKRAAKLLRSSQGSPLKVKVCILKFSTRLGWETSFWFQLGLLVTIFGAVFRNQSLFSNYTVDIRSFL